MEQLAMSVRDIRPIGHTEAMQLATVEYERMADLLEGLAESDWQRPTECVPWNVRDMSTHLLGYLRACCSVREQVRQLRLAKRRDGTIADAISGLQVDELSGMHPAEIVAEYRAKIPGAVAGRRRLPAVVRRFGRVSTDLPVAGTTERWTIGFLNDIIGTRDSWMHRTDVCRAVDRHPVLTGAHDGRLVADVVADWARRHGRPFELVLDGPAGGNFRAGDEGPRLQYDAVEFCRFVSGRGDELPFDTEVPF